jgi:predicted transcriptional regulator
MLQTMTKRLQVLVDDEELREIQELARRRHQTTAAWVRDALRVARDTPAHPGAGRKLRAVREAVAQAYPVAGIDDMIDEIERGCADGASG